MTRTQYQGYWITDLGRRLTITEAFGFQGIRKDAIVLGLSNEGSIRKTIGNAMSRGVLEHVLI